MHAGSDLTRAQFSMASGGDRVHATNNNNNDNNVTVQPERNTMSKHDQSILTAQSNER